MPIPPERVNSFSKLGFGKIVSLSYTYQRPLILVVYLCQEIVAGRNSNGSRNNENNNTTLKTTNALL